MKWILLALLVAGCGERAPDGATVETHRWHRKPFILCADGTQAEDDDGCCIIDLAPHDSPCGRAWSLRDCPGYWLGINRWRDNGDCVTETRRWEKP